VYHLGSGARGSTPTTSHTSPRLLANASGPPFWRVLLAGCRLLVPCRFVGPLGRVPLVDGITTRRYRLLVLRMLAPVADNFVMHNQPVLAASAARFLALDPELIISFSAARLVIIGIRSLLRGLVGVRAVALAAIPALQNRYSSFESPGCPLVGGSRESAIAEPASWSRFRPGVAVIVLRRSRPRQAVAALKLALGSRRENRDYARSATLPAIFAIATRHRDCDMLSVSQTNFCQGGNRYVADLSGVQ